MKPRKRQEENRDRQDGWGRTLREGDHVRIEHGRYVGEVVKHWKVDGYTRGVIEKFHPKSDRVTVKLRHYEEFNYPDSTITPETGRKVYSRHTVIRDDEYLVRIAGELASAEESAS